MNCEKCGKGIPESLNYCPTCKINETKSANDIPLSGLVKNQVNNQPDLMAVPEEPINNGIEQPISPVISSQPIPELNNATVPPVITPLSHEVAPTIPDQNIINQQTTVQSDNDMNTNFKKWPYKTAKTFLILSTLIALIIGPGMFLLSRNAGEASWIFGMMLFPMGLHYTTIILIIFLIVNILAILSANKHKFPNKILLISSGTLVIATAISIFRTIRETINIYWFVGVITVCAIYSIFVLVKGKSKTENDITGSPLLNKWILIIVALANIGALGYITVPNLMYQLEATGIVQPSKKVSSKADFSNIGGFGVSLMVHNDKVYYATSSLSSNSPYNKIYVANIDGSDNKLFFTGTEKSEHLIIFPEFILGDYLYASTQEQSYKINLNNPDDFTVLDANLSISRGGQRIDNYFYWYDEGNLFKINLNDGQRNQVLKHNGSIDDFAIYNNDVYYISSQIVNYGLIYKNNDNEIVYSSNGNRLTNFHIKNNYLYFVENEELVKLDLNSYEVVQKLYIGQTGVGQDTIRMSYEENNILFWNLTKASILDYDLNETDITNMIKGVESGALRIRYINGNYIVNHEEGAIVYDKNKNKKETISGDVRDIAYTDKYLYVLVREEDNPQKYTFKYFIKKVALF